MTNLNNQQVPVAKNANVRSPATRVLDFVWVNPPEFLGLLIGEDLKSLIDNFKIFGVM